MQVGSRAIGSATTLEDSRRRVVATHKYKTRIMLLLLLLLMVML